MTHTDIFDESKTFADLGLREGVLQGVTDAGFTHPTDIQARLIPEALAGHDVLGQAKTGTGKTAAFGLPILATADKDTPMSTLIMAPTRELAAQVAAELDELGRHTPIRTVCVVGGESMRKQITEIKKGAQVIVGTPGRIMDLHQRRDIHFDNIKCVVLDEVDRMLDIGFRDDIKKVLGNIRHEHQTIFVSATIDGEIERLGRQFMRKNPTKIATASGSLTVSLVEQRYLSVEAWDKRTLLLHLLRHEEPATTLVFCRTKMTVQRVAKYLRDKGVNAREIHGDLRQQKRNKVMDSMRKGNLDVLIASDLAARGLDIDHVTHVINYDLPEDPEVYIHRIGRTARAGRTGTAWAFVTPEQGQLLTEIEKLAGVLIEHMEYPSFKPGPIPEDMRHERRRSQTAPAVDPGQHAKSRTAPVPVADVADDELRRMFPNGVIPTTTPKRSLGSRFRTRRR